MCACVRTCIGTCTRAIIEPPCLPQRVVCIGTGRTGAAAAGRLTRRPTTRRRPSVCRSGDAADSNGGGNAAATRALAGGGTVGGPNGSAWAYPVFLAATAAASCADRCRQSHQFVQPRACGLAWAVRSPPPQHTHTRAQGMGRDGRHSCAQSEV